MEHEYKEIPLEEAKSKNVNGFHVSPSICTYTKGYKIFNFVAVQRSITAACACFILILCGLLSNDKISMRWFALVMLSTVIYYTINRTKKLTPSEAFMYVFCYWSVASFMDTRDAYTESNGIRWNIRDSHTTLQLFIEVVFSIFSCILPLIFNNFRYTLHSQLIGKTEVIYFMMLCNSIYTPFDTLASTGYTPILLIRSLLVSLAIYMTIRKFRFINQKNIMYFGHPTNMGTEVAIDIMAILFASNHLLPLVTIIELVYSLVRMNRVTTIRVRKQSK